MSPSALLVLIASWSFVLSLTVWAWSRVLRAPRPGGAPRPSDPAER